MQRCRKKVTQSGRDADEKGTRHAEVQTNNATGRAEVQEGKAPSRQRCRSTKRQTDTGAEEQTEGKKRKWKTDRAADNIID